MTINKQFAYQLFTIILFITLSVTCKKDNTSLLIELNSIPILNTLITSNVKQTTADCDVNIENFENEIITEMGVCWSTGQSPSINDSRTTENNVTSANFTSHIVGLAPNTTYYVRAYAINNAGTGYGNVLSFNTLITIGYSKQVEQVQV